MSKKKGVMQYVKLLKNGLNHYLVQTVGADSISAPTFL